MDIHINRIDPSLDIPKYETEGAVAFDLLAREDTVIPARAYGVVPNNIIVKIPEGHMLMIASRSSTLRKTGLMVGNGVGTIDQDYHGPEDELMTLFYNTTDQDVTVKRGDRLSQAVFIKITRAKLVDTENTLKDESRGGFGSTG